MRATTCLGLLAAGAIATFAVHVPDWPVNMQVAGLILMATGIAGFFVPARPSEWMRRRIIVHGELRAGDPAGQDYLHEDDEHYLDEDDERYPAYLWQDPAVLAAQVLSDIEAAAAASRTRAHPGGRRPGLRLAGPPSTDIDPASRRLRSVRPPEENRQAGTG